MYIIFDITYIYYIIYIYIYLKEVRTRMQCFRASREQRLFQAFLPASVLRGALSDLFSSQSNGFQQPSNGFKKPLVRWVRKHWDVYAKKLGHLCKYINFISGQERSNNFYS